MIADAVPDAAIGDRIAGRAGNALYARLSGQIVRGELAPGVHLVEQQLAAELGTGRTPVRAALQRLVQDGLAVAGGESRSKVLIAPMSSTELVELAAILGALDGLASATVATRTASERSPIVSRLRTNHRLFARAARARTDVREELFDLHRAFHGMIVSDSLLHVVASVRAPVALRMQRYEWVHGSAPAKEMAASVAEHDAVIDAIADGSGERAELAMRTNWNNAAKRLRALLPVLMIFFAAPAVAQGVTGRWTGPVTDPQGDSHPLIVVLKADGNTVTGSVTADGDPQPIVGGRLKGDSLSFALVRTRADGDSSRITFAAKVSGNQMQGSATMADGPVLPFTLTRVPAGASDAASQIAPGLVSDTGPPNPKGRDPGPVDAQSAILAAFDKYDVVAGLGVTNKETDDLILALIRNPAFAVKVNDIAVECSNSLYQPILDRYIAGEDVPLSAVRPVWRNTTQPSCGFSAFYEELFPLVRRINSTLPPERRLRVLACDPPIDWSKVTTPDDAKAFGDRDQSIAAVMEREVLAKHRKALMLYGIGHVRHGTRTAVGRYEARYPNRTLVVVDYHGFGEGTPLARFNDVLEKRMMSWPVPSLVPMQDSWLADVPCVYFDDHLSGSNCRGYPGVDALLYVGPRDLLLYEPIPAGIALDTAYMSELRRRAAALGNPNGPWNPDLKLNEEAGWSVFLYNPPAKGRPGQ